MTALFPFLYPAITPAIIFQTREAPYQLKMNNCINTLVTKIEVALKF